MDVRITRVRVTDDPHHRNTTIPAPALHTVEDRGPPAQWHGRCVCYIIFVEEMLVDHVSEFITAVQDAIGRADAYGFAIVNGGCASEALDELMVIASMAGLGSVQTGLSLLLIMAGLVGDRAGWRLAGCAGLAAFALSGLAAQGAKMVWSRPRPLLQLYEVRFVDGPLFANSFPSGHAMTSFAVMVACSVFVPRLRYPLIGVAAACAVSRVYLGVHFPLDVIFGSFAGVLIGTASARLVRAGFARQS